MLFGSFSWNYLKTENCLHLPRLKGDTSVKGKKNRYKTIELGSPKEHSTFHIFPLHSHSSGSSHLLYSDTFPSRLCPKYNSRVSLSYF